MKTNFLVFLTIAECFKRMLQPKFPRSVCCPPKKEAWLPSAKRCLQASVAVTQIGDSGCLINAAKVLENPKVFVAHPKKRRGHHQQKMPSTLTGSCTLEGIKNHLPSTSMHQQKQEVNHNVVFRFCQKALVFQRPSVSRWENNERIGFLFHLKSPVFSAVIANNAWKKLPPITSAVITSGAWQKFSDCTCAGLRFTFLASLLQAVALCHE